VELTPSKNKGRRLTVTIMRKQYDEAFKAKVATEALLPGFLMSIWYSWEQY